MKNLFLAFVCTTMAVVSAATKESMSPFDDAVYWFRGGVDLNGNGILDSGSSEFRDVTHAGVASHAKHKMTLAQSSAATYEMLGAGKGRVVMPHAGRVLTDAPYLHLPQRFVTNGILKVETGTDVVTTNEYPYGTLNANFINLPNLLSEFPSGVDCTNYTVFIRFRDLERVSGRQYEHNLFQLGYDWGGKCGVSLNVSSSGNYVYPKPYFGSAQQNLQEDALKMPYGRWCDLAMVVQGRQVLFVVCPNVNDTGVVSNYVFGVKTVTADASVNPAIKSNMRHVWRIGGESAGVSGVFTNGLAYTAANGKAGGTHDDGALSNRAKALRGDVQSFAFWTRALTTNEVLRVFSERRPAVVQLGLANGGSDEFMKESDAVDANGLHPETWNPVLNAAHPALTINFQVVDGEQGVSQYLRLRSVAGSEQATISFAIDGKALGVQTVLNDRDALVYVKSDYLTKGVHALTLTRTDARGGDFTVDAVTLYGSWRIGDTSNSYGGMVHETEYPYQYITTPRTFPLTDGNLAHFARGLSGGNNNKHVIPFDVPGDLLNRMRDAELTLEFNGGTIGFNVLLNDELLAENVPSDAGTQHVTVPVKKLRAGANTLAFHQQSGTWGNIKRYSLSLGRPVSGCLMILK